jgi:chromosome segregation ATPase
MPSVPNCVSYIGVGAIWDREGYNRKIRPLSYSLEAWMEFEQIVKRLEWLDEEHRKDKEALKTLEERLTSLDGDINTLSKQIKDLNKKVSAIGPVNDRIGQFEEVVSKQRAEMNKALDDLEKKHQRRERDRIKRHQADLEEINKSLPKLDQSKDITQLKKSIKERSDEDTRLNVALSELKPKVEDAIRRSEDAKQSQKAIEDGRRQDVKRVADMQGEITALRKRIDEFRQKTELQGDSLRNIENRFTELISSEAERKQAQVAFLEQQSLAQIERDKAYKAWVEEVGTFKKQTETLDSQTQELDETLRAAKRAQETYLELNQKLERRINEITEMQRLGEERLRQEWVTFKAEDQKRWTGYTLSSEESLRDIHKIVDKYEERVTAIDDATQTIQDQLHQTTDATEQQLQELMNVTHQWLTAYEQIMGHVKKTPQ